MQKRNSIILTGDSAVRLLGETTSDELSTETDAVRNMLAVARLYEVFTGADVRTEMLFNQKLLGAKDQNVIKPSKFIRGLTGDDDFAAGFKSLIESDQPTYTGFFQLFDDYIARINAGKRMENLATFFEPGFTSILSRQARNSTNEVIFHFHRDAVAHDTFIAYIFMYSSLKARDMFYMLKFKVRVPNVKGKHLVNKNSPLRNRLLNAIINKAKDELLKDPDAILADGNMELGFMSSMIHSERVHSDVAHNPAWSSIVQLHREQFDRRVLRGIRNEANPLFCAW